MVCADFVELYIYLLRNRHRLEMLFGLKVFKIYFCDHYAKMVCADFVELYIYLLRNWHRLEMLYGLKVFKIKIIGL